MSGLMQMLIPVKLTMLHASKDNVRIESGGHSIESMNYGRNHS